MHNRMVKSQVRTAVKKFEAAVAAADKAKAAVYMAESFKLLDSSVSKKVMHKNTADRKKSRMNAAYNKLA